MVYVVRFVLSLVIFNILVLLIWEPCALWPRF